MPIIPECVKLQHRSNTASVGHLRVLVRAGTPIGAVGRKAVVLPNSRARPRRDSLRIMVLLQHKKSHVRFTLTTSDEE